MDAALLQLLGRGNTVAEDTQPENSAKVKGNRKKAKSNAQLQREFYWRQKEMKSPNADARLKALLEKGIAGFGYRKLRVVKIGPFWSQKKQKSTYRSFLMTGNFNDEPLFTLLAYCGDPDVNGVHDMINTMDALNFTKQAAYNWRDDKRVPPHAIMSLVELSKGRVPVSAFADYR